MSKNKKKKRFKDLTEKDIEFIKKSYFKRGETSWEKTAFNLGEHFNVSERTIRKWVSEKLDIGDKEIKEPEEYLKAKERQYDKRKEKIYHYLGSK